jgi:hypothetical protein
MTDHYNRILDILATQNYHIDMIKYDPFYTESQYRNVAQKISYYLIDGMFNILNDNHVEQIQNLINKIKDG